MDASILIMTKAPRAGQVKTRLQPLLGPEGCARLQTDLIRHTARLAAGVGAPTWVAFAPRDGRAEIRALVGGRARLFAQAGGHLGERLVHAVRHVHGERPAPLLVIGSDSPLLGPAHLGAASAAIAAGHEVALVPALDGGYALIALARPIEAAFGIPPMAWGGPDVLSLTLAALRVDGRRAAVLEPVPDLDTPQDARALGADPRCPPALRTELAAADHRAA